MILLTNTFKNGMKYYITFIRTPNNNGDTLSSLLLSQDSEMKIFVLDFVSVSCFKGVLGDSYSFWIFNDRMHDLVAESGIIFWYFHTDPCLRFEIIK